MKFKHCQYDKQLQDHEGTILQSTADYCATWLFLLNSNDCRLMLQAPDGGAPAPQACPSRNLAVINSPANLPMVHCREDLAIGDGWYPRTKI